MHDGAIVIHMFVIYQAQLFQRVMADVNLPKWFDRRSGREYNYVV